MEFPGSKFTHPWRHAVLIAFFVMFFVITPIAIGYTAGYRYDWRNGLLKETGALSVDVDPASATVYLDEIKVDSRMPVRLKNLTPRKYTVRITADGYFDWVKEVEVKNMQTAYIKEIGLVKRSWPQLLHAGQADNAALSYDGRYLAFTENNKLFLRDITTGQETAITLANAISAIKWAGSNNYLAVAGGDAPYRELLVFSADYPEKRLDLFKVEKTPITKFQWKETLEPELFFSSARAISSIKSLTGNRYRITPNNFIDWHMENGQLWTLQTSSLGIKIVNDTLGFSSDFAVLPAVENYTIAFAYRGHVLLKNKFASDMLLIRRDETFKIAGDHFFVSRYNNWWLIWTPWEVWTYSEGEEPTLLNRSGEGLKSVLPLDEYNTLGLVWNNKTTVLYPYYLVTHDLLNIGVVSATADSKKHILYFSGKVGDQTGLWQLEY